MELQPKHAPYPLSHLEPTCIVTQVTHMYDVTRVTRCVIQPGFLALFFSHYFCMFTFKYHLQDTPSLNMLLAHWIHIEFNFIHTLQSQFIAV